MIKKFTDRELQIAITAAHEASWDNLERLKTAKKCGCFYCCKIFDAKEIKDYGSDTTALCPYCGIDSVLGDNEGFPITQEFLRTMNNEWF
ncbi:MAG: cytoplasmic protein [Bacillota bacterium]|nr:cytoplasmic protein [Bacillota bacterium]